MEMRGPHGRDRRPTFATILGDHLALVVLVVLILLSLQIAAPVRAQDLPEAYWGGDLLLGSGKGGVQPALQLRTDYNIVTDGGMRRVWLRQTFRNDSSELRQGLYLFELPEGSSVTVMRMTLDGREIMNGKPARALARRQALRGGRKAHVESVSLQPELQGVVFQEVLGIPPAEAVVVELVYEQALTAGEGLRTVALPMPLPSFQLLSSL